MSRRLRLAAALLVGACAAPARPVEVPTPSGGPRAPGVAVDPLSAAPKASRAAPASDGVVVLAEPLDRSAALSTIDAFFDAMVTESAPALERVLTRAAHLRSASSSRPEAALPSLRRRIDRLDYAALSDVVLFRPETVRIYGAEDGAGDAPRNLPVLPRDRELLVLVRLAAASASALFGEEVAFLLEPSPGEGFKIRELFEEFRLP